MQATQTRQADLEAAQASTEAMTVPLVLSTEYPVDRGGFVEVLDHTPDAVDLSRAPLPFIESHDTGRLNIGVVEALRLAGGKLRGELRLGTSDRARELMQDILAGIVTSVSIGYRIFDEQPGADQGTILVTQWQPFEVSAVSVPADPTAGFFRAEPMRNTPMSDHENETNDPNAGQVTLTRSERRNQNRAMDAERQRVSDLLSLGESYARFGGREVAKQAIREGRDDDWFCQTVLQRADSSHMPAPDPYTGKRDAFGNPAGELGLSGREMEDYSLVRAIRAMVDPKASKDAGLEIEASRAIAKELRRETSGILVPVEVQRQYANRSTLTAGATGAALVGTDHMGGSFIDVLRNKSVAFEAGMQPMRGLQGDVSIPLKTDASTGAWIDGDGEALALTAPTLGYVTLSPRTVGGLASFSHRMLLQSSPEVEGLLRNDLASTLQVEIDRAVLNGSGINNEPTGILNTTGIGADTYTGSPNYSDIIGAETLVADHNADSPQSIYVTSPALRGTLKGTDIGSDTGQMIWTNGGPGEGMMNGYRALATKNMPADAVLFGDFSQVLFGEWGILELMADPYHEFEKGSVRVRALYSCDIALRHPKAFAAITSA